MLPTVLVACLAGCAGGSETRIQLTVHASLSFQLTMLEVAAAGRTSNKRGVRSGACRGAGALGDHDLGARGVGLA